MVSDCLFCWWFSTSTVCMADLINPWIGAPSAADGDLPSKINQDSDYDTFTICLSNKHTHRSQYMYLQNYLWYYTNLHIIRYFVGLLIFCLTSRSRICHLGYRDVTITGEGLHNLGLCSALRAFEQGGIFIVPHLLWHGASVFLVSSEGPPNSVVCYDTRGGCRGSILTHILTVIMMYCNKNTFNFISCRPLRIRDRTGSPHLHGYRKRRLNEADETKNRGPRSQQVWHNEDPSLLNRLSAEHRPKFIVCKG
jgi:hypothetical protein